jgi:hypothetical protein
MEKNKNIRYEFYSYEAGPTGTFNTTLVFENPASLKFVLVGNGGLADQAIINNVYRLDPLNNFVTGLAKNPYELILNNNINEIDKTVYTIRINNPTINTIILKVIVKYLIP